MIDKAEIERKFIESYERLKRGGALYDIGHHSEAPNIAKEIVNLVHDKGKAHVSLLTSMGAKEAVSFVDSSNHRDFPPEQGTLLSSEYILIRQTIGFDGMDYVPNAGRNGQAKTLSFSEWKNGHVLSRNNKKAEREFISREEIYKFIRHNEGGGHVNARYDGGGPQEKLILLMRGAYVDGYMHINDGPAITAESFMPAYATVRQIGWELEKTLEGYFPSLIARSRLRPASGPRMKPGTR